MVDDEPNVLSGYRRTLGRTFDLVIANGGQEGLIALETDGPFEVVFTDMRMPGMDGLEFLIKAREKHTKPIYAMLTGNADQLTAINAINQGKIFRFLNKPCDPETLAETISVCKAQYELVQAESVLLHNTLTGSIKLLIEAIVITDPAAEQAVRVIRDRVQKLLEALGLKNDWRIPLASSLFIVGGITIPRASGAQILEDEYIEACAHAGAKLLRHIARLEEVAQMIMLQRTPAPMPEVLSLKTESDRVTVVSQLLRFAFDWYRVCEREKCNTSKAIDILASQSQSHDERLVDAARVVLEQSGIEDQNGAKWKALKIEVRDLREGMRTEQPISTTDGALLVAKDHVLSQLMIDRLRGFAKAGHVSGLIRVSKLCTPGDVSEIAA